MPRTEITNGGVRSPRLIAATVKTIIVTANPRSWATTNASGLGPSPKAKATSAQTVTIGFSALPSVIVEIAFVRNSQAWRMALMLFSIIKAGHANNTGPVVFEPTSTPAAFGKVAITAAVAKVNNVVKAIVNNARE